ncbi:MAG TPA: S-layer homology domain-containing protein, partial [Polyangiaceae bacterium]|nr:S-layer homology domain-containing protein [Polyangiaceae bacterium]
CKAQCAWDGNLIQKDCSVVKCTSVGASCVDDSQGLRCASVFCIDKGKTSAKEICLPDGSQASCGSKGDLKNISKCPSGQTCVQSGGETRCGLECSKEPTAGAENEVFKDMAPGTFGHDEAIALHDAGIVSGCQASPKLFCGTCELTRQALAKMVVLAAKLPLLSPSKATFSDFPPSSALYTYVETAAAAGIMTGYPGGEFRPNNPVTRGVAAVVIARAAQLSAPSAASASFKDVPADSWWSDGIEALGAHCVATGCSKGNFCPDKLITRRAAAVLVTRAFGMAETPCGGFVGDSDPGVDPDLDPDAGDDVPVIADEPPVPAVSRGKSLAAQDDAGCSVSVAP